MYHVLNNNINQRNESGGSLMTIHYKQEHNILVSSKNGLQERKVIITIENSMYNLKITLADESDVFFLYTVNITNEDYLILKNEQGLLINFPDFPDQIVNLLKQCISGKMFLQLVLVKLNLYNLEFIERSDFKNLMHLQLKMFPCENDEIMSNISQKITYYKETIQMLEKKNELLNSEVATLMKDNEALCKGITEAENKIRRELAEQIHRNEMEHRKKLTELESQLFKSRDEIQNLQSSLKELTNTQKNLKNQNTQYVTTIENMNKEIEKLQTELKVVKLRNSQFDEEFRKKDMELNSARTSTAVLEQSLKEKVDIISMLKETLSRNEKEIEALRSSSAIKSEQEMKAKVALKETAEDLIKANQIITQNNINYDQLKKKHNVVSKILINLEKDHTKLQEEFEQKLKLLENLQKQNEEYRSELAKINRDNECLVKLLKSKDENITELKRIIESQQQQLKSYEEHRSSKENVPMNQQAYIVPTAFTEWKPLPSPIPNNQDLNSIQSPQQCELRKPDAKQRSKMPPISQRAAIFADSLKQKSLPKKIDPKFPSSYFTQPTTSKTK